MAETPLHYACDKAPSTLPSTSSERNTVTHHVRSSNGTTPLHRACFYGQPHIVQSSVVNWTVNPSCEDK